ncbi:hypothetical protein MNV49_006651 [Pseudohyphozyma bogoriensis]|nr:hypothetical protein MNV49_006651 [Pseudohyphozyma bogoriensis]
MRLLLQNAFLYPLSSFLGSPGPSSVSSSGMTSVFTPTNYSVVPGFFIQDEPGFNSTGYDPLLDSFGLLDKSPDRWHNFIRAVNDLNVNSDSLTSYKVLFVARHGQGFHNLAEEKYGTPAWDAYWSRLTTDGEITVLYSSPLSRAASTLAITWRDILIEPLGLAPLFKENLRRPAKPQDGDL